MNTLSVMTITNVKFRSKSWEILVDLLILTWVRTEPVSVHALMHDLANHGRVSLRNSFPKAYSSVSSWLLSAHQSSISELQSGIILARNFHNRLVFFAFH